MAEQASITKEFLESVLHRKVIKFEASAGSKPGDNFMCVLISLEIHVEDQHEPLYLVMKTFPNHPTRRKIMEDTNTHLKEYQMYKIFLPELMELQKSIIKPNQILVPAVPEVLAAATVDYSADPSEWSESDPILSNYLLMVDVRKSYGFHMANKMEGLGYYHVKSVIEELAKYHALGHAYKHYHKLPSILSKFPFMTDRFYCAPNQRAMMVVTMKESMQLVLETCKDFLEKKPSIRERLRKYEDPEFLADQVAMFMDSKGVDEKYMEAAMRKIPEVFSGEPIQDQWITSNHGDCWTNNILFKKGEDGNVTKCILVDLQETKECCAMFDVVYILYTSTDTDFRRQYMDEMLKLYFDRFLHYCGILKVPPFPGFTMHNLLRKFQRSKLFGFLLCSFVIPLFLQKPETIGDMDSMDMGGMDEKGTEIWADVLKKVGDAGKEDGDKLLRERFNSLMLELEEDGVL